MVTTALEVTAMLKQVSQGNHAAFTALYRATSSKLFGVALRITKNQAEAEDVLQETYVKIWRYADRYVPEKFSPISWMVAVARNKSIDVLRKRRPSHLDLDVALEVADPAASPEQLYAKVEEQDRIATLMGRLDLSKFVLVQGAYVEGATYAQLSDRYSIPLNTVRTHLRRSLKQMQDMLP